jgi:hypothetical protein
MNYNNIVLETPKDKEKENRNEIKEEEKYSNNIGSNLINNNMINIINVPIPDIQSKDYILYLENEKDKNNKFCLNLFHDTTYFYFKLNKIEPENISLDFFFNKFDYTTLIDKLKINEKLTPDFKSIESLLLESLEKNNVYLKDETNTTIYVIFKMMDKERVIILLKQEMDENQKFEKIMKEISALKNVNEDKIEELKKKSKEIKDETELKCNKNKELLDTLEVLVKQNKVDIDNEANEIELLKEEIQKIKNEIQDKVKNKKDCSIF